MKSAIQVLFPALVVEYVFYQGQEDWHWLLIIYDLFAINNTYVY